jgi:hypothetical protein
VWMIIGCAAFALPAWVACWLITMNEPGGAVVTDRRRTVPTRRADGPSGIAAPRRAPSASPAEHQ